jgi:hypothetical protein
MWVEVKHYRRVCSRLGTIRNMSVSALAEAKNPSEAGLMLRVYVPGIDPTPRLGRDPCSFAGCMLRAARLEPVGTIYWSALCDHHALWDEPEPTGWH